ncbi:hypothetical protein [Mesorhizobium sp. IMUNJ 23232]|uniref:hypothetical protein n=1 Tax=Mesorhizobium sp. IMUNJ 23232 TaxID=3376064 RepID=UPI0037B443FD
MASVVALVSASLLTSITTDNTLAQSKTNATKAELRAEVARRLRREPIIQKVSFDPSDNARLILKVRNSEIEQLEVDVTNLSERMRGLSAKQREARMQRFVRQILKLAASSSPG